MTGGTAKDVAAVVGSAGELVGRTRMQKTMALLEMTGLGYGYKFEYYKFGPYSEDLVASLERAVALQYVSESERRANWGGHYSIFSSTRHEPTGNAARDELIRIARDADAIALELAVTAAFLAAHEGIVDAWGEVSKRKAEKITRGRLDTAKKLYRAFANVKGLEVPLPAIA